MKKTGLSVALIATALCSSSTFAADAADIYVAASYNHLSIDFNNADVDDTEGVGLLFGIDFPENLAFEAEYINSGKTHMDYKVGSIQSAKMQVQSLAMYGVFRTDGKIYFKGRAGISTSLIDISRIQCSGSFCVNDIYDTNLGFAFSAGGGITLNEKINVEAEYKLLNSDIDTLGLGIVYKF